MGSLPALYQVHVSLIGKQHRRWQLVAAANAAGLRLSHSAPFSKALLPGYQQARETGGDASTFPMEGISRTFCFVRSEAGPQAMADFSAISPASREEWLAHMARTSSPRIASSLASQQRQR